MTIDVRHDLGKEERVALAVLGFGSLITLCVGYALLLNDNKTLGFVIISISGVILLSVLFINSLFYTNTRTYNRFMLLLNPNAALSEVQHTGEAEDSPPSYKKSWAKAFNQRTNAASNSTSTEAGGSTPPPGDVDLERHLCGRLEGGKGRPEWRKQKGAKKHGTRSQAVCDVQEGSNSALDQRDDDGDCSSPPPFEMAISELSAKELAKINETLRESSCKGTYDATQIEEWFPTVLGKSTDVFSVEDEFLRRKAHELRAPASDEILMTRKSDVEVVQVHSPQRPSETRPSTLEDEALPQDVQSNTRVLLLNGRLTARTNERAGGRARDYLQPISPD